jgi:hypothetical protein
MLRIKPVNRIKRNDIECDEYEDPKRSSLEFEMTPIEEVRPANCEDKDRWHDRGVSVACAGKE